MTSTSVSCETLKLSVKRGMADDYLHSLSLVNMPVCMKVASSFAVAQPVTGPSYRCHDIIESKELP